MVDDFALQPTRATRKRTKPPKEPTDSVKVETAFREAFKVRYGFDVISNHGRDRKLLITLIDQWGLDAVMQSIKDFFAATFPGGRGYHEIKRLRWHNVPDFYNGAQILRRINGDKYAGLHHKSAGNAHEIMKAMGMTPGEIPSPKRNLR